jgi:hypothetical protein
MEQECVENAMENGQMDPEKVRMADTDNLSRTSTTIKVPKTDTGISRLDLLNMVRAPNLTIVFRRYKHIFQHKATQVSAWTLEAAKGLPLLPWKAESP